ncbi:hypothetical protein [Streptacidiphilus sp. MAP12-33]|uniref:hypothetical protein n=1 Tax=Streptacidiphilus sp. MAP12-33 TaxID=3156266 RepID=UPI0035165CE7
MRRLGPTFLNHPLRDTARSAAVRGMVGVVVLAVLGAVLTACGNGGNAQTLDGAPASTYSPPPPTVRDVRALGGPTATVVLWVYRSYWDAQIRAMSTGQADGSNLSTYATGAALSESYADVVRLLGDGLLMAGQPVSHPVVTAIGALPGDPKESQATLQDCLDVSGWHQVSAHGGRITDPGSRLTRYPLIVTARTVQGAWMISEITRETGRTC